MIQVIQRSAQIINIIASDKTKAWPMSVIADTLNINRGTCANILKSLVATGFLEKSINGKGYVLGYQFYNIAGDNRKGSLVSLVKPHIDRLVSGINETVMLSILKGKTRILMYQATCNHEVQVFTAEKSSVFKTTTGKMILSRYSHSQIERFIETFGIPDDEWPEITGIKSFIDELERISKLDCLVTISDTHVAALAVPIEMPNHSFASLGIYLPDIRFSEERETVLRSKLLETKKIIEESLNCIIL